jgi:hypothetical protein
MSFVPGWDSAETTAAIAHNLHITAIVVLGLLFVSEGMALIYDSRKEHLVSLAAGETEAQRKRDADAAEARHRADVEGVQKQLTEANKKVAELDKLRQPRHLSAEQKATIEQVLRTAPNSRLTIKAGTAFGDEHAYAEEIASALRGAGWTVNIDNAIHLGSDVTGIWLKVGAAPGTNAPEPVAALFATLDQAGLGIRKEIQGEPSLPPGEIWLNIGAKKSTE